MKKLLVLLTLLFSCSVFATTFKAPVITGKDQYNIEQSLEKYKGKNIILIFWASWCPTCQKELYSLDNLYKIYGENKNDVIFLGVNSENREEITKYINDRKHIMPTIINDRAFNEYRIKAFPTMFIIDKKGNVSNYVVGGVPEETLKKYIDTNLLQKTF